MRRRSWQPYSPLPIDQSNPLTSGLVASYYNSAIDYSRPPQNYAGQVETTNAAQAVTPFSGGSMGGTNVAAIRNPPRGVTPMFTPASSSAAKAKFDLSTLSKLTISFWLWWRTFASDDKLLLEYTSNYNANNGFLIDLNSSTTSQSDFNVHINGQYCKNWILSGSDQLASQWHHYAWLIDLTLASSQTVAIYLDGVAQALTAGQNTIPANQSFASDYLYFMGRAMSSLFGDGSLAYFNIHNRLLSQGEIRALMENPHQILMPTNRPLRLPAIASGGGGGGGGSAAYRWFLSQ